MASEGFRRLVAVGCFGKHLGGITQIAQIAQIAHLIISSLAIPG